MVAFITSLVLTAAMVGGVILYARRRPVGTPLTWGEAMVAAVYVFMLMTLAYGVVPNQWILWADSPSMDWSIDRSVSGLERVLPFDVKWLHLRDFIVVGIYFFGLGVNIWLWSFWQNRGKTKPEPEQVMHFGRPLVKELS